MKTKICVKCKKSKPFGQFNTNAALVDGLTIYCKACISSGYTYGSKTWQRAMLNNVKTRASRKKIPCDVSAIRELLADPPVLCPALGIKLTAGSHGHQGPASTSATIDQRVAGKGYVEGNMDIIAQRANRIKTDATTAEIRAVAEWVAIVELL